MSDLFSDLVDGSGRDYFYDLESAPGGLSPAFLTLTITGFAPSIQELTEAYRSPTPAALTINGLAFAPDFIVSPAPAALSAEGQIPDKALALTVSPAVPLPDYGELQSTAPTILFINTISPSPAQITLNSLNLNVTPGGNIAFISPGVGSVSIASGEVSIIFHPVDVGVLSILGLQPELLTEMTIGALDEDTPGQATLAIVGLAPTLSRPFGWINVDPQPATTWTTTTSAAA